MPAEAILFSHTWYSLFSMSNVICRAVTTELVE